MKCANVEDWNAAVNRLFHRDNTPAPSPTQAWFVRDIALFQRANAAGGGSYEGTATKRVVRASVSIGPSSWWRLYHSLICVATGFTAKEPLQMIHRHDAAHCKLLLLTQCSSNGNSRFLHTHSSS